MPGNGPILVRVCYPVDKRQIMRSNLWDEIVTSALSGFIVVMTFGSLVLLIFYFANVQWIGQMLRFVVFAGPVAAIGVGICRYFDRTDDF
jgi:hypothetical protein